jgi:CNT family concentrative nucleoside transporter
VSENVSEKLLVADGTHPLPDKIPAIPPTPTSWRLAIAGAILAILVLTYLLRDIVGVRGQSVAGVICFLGLGFLFSANLRAINWRTIGWGMALQAGIALFIMVQFSWGDYLISGRILFDVIGRGFTQFLRFADVGANFVFNGLANQPEMARAFPSSGGFLFLVAVLPPIIFVSSVFTVLYYLGVLQFVVKIFARGMMYLMGTSGAETLSTTANVFMGQTEAPLIIKPFVPRMTRSELLTLMISGMAHIAGAVMAVYIGMGADAVAILATSVMAAPCSLYLTKILIPEMEQPVTSGKAEIVLEKQHANVVDAAAAGASDGMFLAINVTAMLIAFLSIIALLDFLLGQFSGLIQVSLWADFPRLSLAWLFSQLFAPAAFLMGVTEADVPRVAELLGIKLTANEFVAFTALTRPSEFSNVPIRSLISERSFILSTYALTGFANFGSIGIQLGGIGAMAPNRRGEMARLSGLALFGGFLATLINASLAGLFLGN